MQWYSLQEQLGRIYGKCFAEIDLSMLHVKVDKATASISLPSQVLLYSTLYINC